MFVSLPKPRRVLTVLTYGSTLAGLLLIALIWTATVLHLKDERANIEELAIQNASNLAGAFEEHLSRTLNEIDRSIKSIRNAYQTNETRFDLRGWLQRNELFDDKTVQISIVGKDGFIKLSSVASTSSVGTDLRDREHFKFQAAADGDPLHISKPVIGRTTGKWSIQLTRRLRDADGAFDGMIVVSLDPAYLARFYNSVQLGKHGYVRIIGHDGIIRAMGGANSNSLGMDLSNATLFKNFPKKRVSSYYTRGNVSDRTPRLATFRALNDYPLIITIGLAVEEIFARFYVKRTIYFALATAATLAILVVMGFSINGRITRERLARERDIQNKRFDAVLRNMPLGVCMFDRNSRLVLANDRYYDMYKMPEELRAPDIKFLDIVPHQKALGAFSGEAASFFASFSYPLSDNSPSKFLLRLNDGRIISVLRQPIFAGGWISIHEDTTDQELAKDDLEQTKRFLDTVIESVPVSVTVKDAVSGKFILVNQAFETFFGLSREQVVGRTLFDLFPNQIAEHLAFCDQQTIKTRTRRIDVDIPLSAPAHGPRIGTTTRSVVCDADGEPLYIIAVIEDRTEAKRAEEKIGFMALHDPLTGLPNRTQLSRRIEEGLAAAQAGQKMAIHFLDLDQFKGVNDTLGHLVGDELLKQAADRLRRCVRAKDMVARLGGDEFAVVQADVSEGPEIATLAHRIRLELKAPYDLDGLRAAIDVSIGIALAPRDGSSAVELLKRADVALYTAKEEGRGRVRFFEPAMDARMKERLTLEADLRNAIANNEFRLVYEPIINVRTRKIDCIEALIRWFHPSRGLIPPSAFIPLAEETGLIVSIGEWVVRQACADAGTWPEEVRVAVNLSPVQLTNDGLVDSIMSALKASNIAPQRLELEITEAVHLLDNPRNREVLERLRSHGVRIAMDDFGTGYSSLNYLRQFVFDRIKIDRSFVADLSPYNELALVIVQSVARIAGVLEVSVTAEGVETLEQLELIKAAGCTHYQGHLLGGARTAVQMAELLAKPQEALSIH